MNIQDLTAALNKALGLGEQCGYECEHGQPCEPGGKTACVDCPQDPRRVKYRPVYEDRKDTHDIEEEGSEEEQAIDLEGSVASPSQDSGGEVR